MLALKVRMGFTVPSVASLCSKRLNKVAVVQASWPKVPLRGRGFVLVVFLSTEHKLPGGGVGEGKNP